VDKYLRAGRGHCQGKKKGRKKEGKKEKKERVEGQGPENHPIPR